MELKGSKTEQNLWIAFAGESQARNKYDYYASKAKKEGYEQIAAIFQETALNEKEHAKLWFKALDGIGSTEENLVAAAAGENEGAGIPKKPHPAMVDKLLRELGASREGAVYVGDSDVDIATAKNAGLPCISVTWGFRDRAFLLKHGADTLIDSPEELVEFL